MMERQIPPVHGGSLIRIGIFIGIALHFVMFFVVIQRQSFLADDSIQYLTIAENLYEFGLFSQSVDSPVVADAQKTPGYPFFILLLGMQPWLIIFIQHLLAIATAFLLGAILKSSKLEKVAPGFVLLYLIQPYSLVFAGLILSETLFIFLIVALIWYWKRWSEEFVVRDLSISAAILAIAVFVKPVAIILIVLFPVIAATLIFSRKKAKWQALLMPAVLTLILGPWVLRNREVTGRFSISSMGSPSLIHGRLGGMISQTGEQLQNETAWYLAGDSILADNSGFQSYRIYPEGKQTHESVVFAESGMMESIVYAWDHPGNAVSFLGRSFWNMAKGAAYGWSFSQTGNRPFSMILAGLQIACNIFMISGFFIFLFRIGKQDFFSRTCSGVVLSILVVSAVVWADGRYRMILDPVLLVITAYSLPWFGKRNSKV